jgi:hypothetical protein
VALVSDFVLQAWSQFPWTAPKSNL